VNTNIEATRRFTAGAAQAGTEVRKLAAAWSDETAASARAAASMQRVAAARQESAAELERIRQATSATIAAQDKSNESLGKTSGAMGILSTLMNTTTTQISSQGTAWAGYDAPVSAVIRSLGGMSVGMSLLLTVGGTLIGHFLELGEAQDKQKEVSEDSLRVTEELIQRDIDLARVFGQLTNASDIFKGSLNQQNDSLKQILGVDLAATMLNFAKASDQANDKTNEAIRAQNILRAANEGLADQQNELAFSQYKMKVLTGEVAVSQEEAAKVATSFSRTEEALNYAMQQQVEAIDAAKLAMQTEENERSKAEGTLREHSKSLIRLVDTLNISEQKLRDQASQLGINSSALEQMIGVLYGTARAELEWAAALDTVRIAQRNLSATSEGQAKTREQLNDQINRDLAAGKSQRDVYLANQAAIEDQVRAKQKELTVTHALTDGVNKKKQTELEAARALQQTADTAATFFAIHEKVASSVQRGAEHHKGGAAAARSYSNALIDLAKRADEAEIALRGSTPGAQEAKFHIEAQALRAHLQVNNRDRAAALAAIDRMERAQIAGIEQARLNAEQDVYDRIRQIQIRGIKEETDRRQATIVAEFAQEERRLRKMSDDDIFIFIALDDYKRALEGDYLRWLSDETDKFNVKALEAERNLAGDIYKIRVKLLDDVHKSNVLWWRQQNRLQIEQMKEVERVRNQLLSRIRPGALSDEQSFAINLRIEGSLDKLKDVGIAASDVDKYFGSASRSVDQFEERVRLLTATNVSAIDVLRQMVDWEGVLTAGIHAFTDAIAGAVAGTDSLGHALLVSFFRIIGEIAIQLGTLFVLAAAGFAFIPGLNWSAGALAAAGIAMLAFGAVMTGLASKFSQHNSSASAGSGSAASGGSAATATGRSGPPTNVIPFPTSGSRNSQPLIIQLDRNLSNDLIEGKQVLTRTNVQKTHKDVIRKVANF
jgi:hypothetical protein